MYLHLLSWSVLTPKTIFIIANFFLEGIRSQITQETILLKL